MIIKKFKKNPFQNYEMGVIRKLMIGSYRGMDWHNGRRYGEGM